MYWDSSIQKIIKDVDPSRSLSNVSREIINSLIDFLIEQLAKLSRVIARESKTCTRKVMSAMILTFLSDVMYTHVSEREKGVLLAYREAEKGQRLEEKAGLKISVSRVRKSFRLRTCLKLSEEAMISLSSMIDYIIGELLELCCIEARESGRVRITPSFIARAIHSDPEFKVMFKDFKIPGVVSYSKQDHLQRQEGIGGRPYTKYAVRFLKNDSGLLLKSPFRRLVRSHLKNLSEQPTKVSSKAMILLQTLTEDFGFELGKCTTMFTYFAKRKVTNAEDIEAALKIKGIELEKRLKKLTLSKPGLQRLLRKANAVKISSEVYLIFNSAIENYLTRVVRMAFRILRYEGKRTLKVSHIRKALEVCGVYI